MRKIIECIPNFSEGRDTNTIESIVDAINASGDVKILGCERGEAAGRTVVTFAGEAEAVCEAAFRAVKTAGKLIDMRVQQGTHPRTGATDVLPLVPISGISMDECVILARRLAERIYTELGIPCNLYGKAALRPERSKLEVCRIGQYEALAQRMANPDTRPDFSPESYDDITAKSGVCNVGARDFLIAVNFNLDTDSASAADEIACEVREKGKTAYAQDGSPLKNADGRQIWIPGPLKGCKAIGWYIDEYGIAQVSMNITDISATPLHMAYEQVCRTAAIHGIRVTGTEIIGLVPKKSLTEAGKHFLGAEADDKTLIQAAVKAMNLNELVPFEPNSKILEYALGATETAR